jgi:hypothetical protein
LAICGCMTDDVAAAVRTFTARRHG